MRNINREDRWQEIRSFIKEARNDRNYTLNLVEHEKEKLVRLIKKSCNIDLDLTQASNLSCMEILVVATRFYNEKYSFRANLLGVSVNSIKTHENRVRIKLGLESLERVKYWFLETRLVRVFPEKIPTLTPTYSSATFHFSPTRNLL